MAAIVVGDEHSLNGQFLSTAQGSTARSETSCSLGRGRFGLNRRQTG
jgi:hypothetical protein